jgi:NarL family two-component system response regulator YdfI
LVEGASLLVASACLNGMLVVASRNRINADVPLVILAPGADPHMEADLLRAGAMGVLPTTVDKDTLVRAAADALVGRSTATAAAIGRLAEPVHAMPAITPRQETILHALARGKTTRQIASDLVLTESTVKTHIGRLAARFAVSGRSELRHLAPRILAQRGPARP